TSSYDCHVLTKELDCEDIRLAIDSELLLGNPTRTLVNKHASHVWSKIMELLWTPSAPPIFAFANKLLKRSCAAFVCHETVSLVVQHTLKPSVQDGIVDELLNQGSSVFREVAKSQLGTYCNQHILALLMWVTDTPSRLSLTLDHLISDLLEYATNKEGYKSVLKALEEGGKDALDNVDMVVNRMCELAKSARCAMVVDLALSVTGSQL
ncbi:hypothetical protein EV421DRAFT_1662822, partial [Armillaria borealis]